LNVGFGSQFAPRYVELVMDIFGGAVASSDEDAETFQDVKWRQERVVRTLRTSNNLSTMTSYGVKWSIDSNSIGQLSPITCGTFGEGQR
jgi:hypothetical protein